MIVCGKVKFLLEKLKAQVECRGVALLCPNLDARWGGW
jgi:hypothetical protein